MRTINPEELKQILADHASWLSDKGGAKANLSRADLSSADLSSADLRSADLRGADLRSADLSRADLRSADLSSADLRSADLSRADLRSADLSSADLDFSVLPLRCGGLRWHIDRRIAAQIAYHFCSMVCDDPDFIRIRESMLDFANNFHRVNECGRLLPSVNTGEQERPEK